MSQSHHYKALSLSEPGVELTILHSPSGETIHSTVQESDQALGSPNTDSLDHTIVGSSQNLTKRSTSVRVNGGDKHEDTDPTDVANGDNEDPKAKEPRLWSPKYYAKRLREHLRPHKKIGNTPSVWRGIRAIICTSCTIPRCNEHSTLPLKHWFLCRVELAPCLHSAFCECNYTRKPSVTPDL